MAQRPQRWWGTWGAASALSGPLNDLNYVDEDPWVSADKMTMLFTCNRPGGYGGLDMYGAEWNSSAGIWDNVTNLGSSVNTEADDYAPFYVESSGMLYFVRVQSGDDTRVPMQVPAVPEPAGLLSLVIAAAGVLLRHRRAA